MRVLFSCRPAYGHVYPLLPLALACRDAGHEVVFGTGEGFRPRLRELGFRAEEAVRALLSEPGYREAARVLAGEIAAMPSPAETVPVPVLEGLAAAGS